MSDAGKTKPKSFPIQVSQNNCGFIALIMNSLKMYKLLNEKRNLFSERLVESFFYGNCFD